MAIPVLVLGDSGTGKTTSLRNLNPESTLLIQAIPKRLPFRNQWEPCTQQNPSGSIVVSDQYQTAHAFLNRAERLGKSTVIIDDANYLMMNESMRKVDERGFDKFTQMAKNYWQLIDHAQQLPNDIRVYFMTHTQESETGLIKPKTCGKLLDNQIVIEGLFSIVLRCHAQDDRHFFTTKTNGLDPVKTPIDMFSQSEIDNDLNAVDETIKQYYNLNY